MTLHKRASRSGTGTGQKCRDNIRICAGYDSENGPQLCPHHFQIETARFPWQLRCLDCRKIHDRFRARRNKRKIVDKGGRPHTRVICTSIRGEQPKPKERKCGMCGSMPWACQPGRFAEKSGGQGYSVVQIAPEWKCIACGLEYAPLEPVERGSLLRSSMGSECRRNGGAR